MDVELRRLIREHYPFPIAHAHKKTLAFLDDDAHKLKCLLQAAEATVQFLALMMLAQLHHDLAQQQAPALGQRGLQLRDDLRNPSFGKWHGLLRDLLKQYHAQRHLLVMPELFEVYFQPGRGSRLTQQPVVQQAIEPLITLRNQFHHPGISDAQIPDKVAMGTHCLEQLLERMQFLHAYPLAFVQRIEVRHDGAAVRHFRHDLVQMQGCFSIFERQRWESDVPLREGRLVLLTSAAAGRSLFLDPFLACAEELPVPGVLDIFLLNGTEQRRVRYLSARCGQELSSDHPTWAQGAEDVEALGQFFDLLRRAPTTDTEVELESAGQALPAAEAERAGASTEEVFRARYQPAAEARRPVSPYKFLDYFEPEDADLFFGRDQEIRQLQRKFHTARLLILHGESGTGKTSLIRAGLLPRLSSESYVPVYVRALQEPARAIREAMVRQLGVDQRHLELPLAQFLDAETAHLSKTVVVILDQFEEFFLRLPLEVRRLFHQELGACVAAAPLDVHFIIALRDDYFSSLAEFQDAIPDLFAHEMRLARFTHAQALAAAVEPVKRVGWSIDEALVAKVILPQLDEPEKGIEPPLLQIVCDALYQQAQDAGRTRIGAEEYAALGDVRQALGRYLNATLRQFGQQQPQARAVLKALVTAEGTKRASFVDEIVARLHSTGLAMTEEAVERDFLRKLLQARLVHVEDVEGRPRYELAHEFLVQQIGTWIAESERELTKVLELIDRAYEAYRATGLLLEPEALALIAPFQDELVMPAEKQRFLDLSRQTARRRRRGLWLRIGALLLLVGLGVGGFLGARLYRSKQQLEGTNANLKQALQQSETQTRLANQHLAEALVEKGLPLFEQRNFHASYIFGAKALVLDPTSARARSLAYLSAISAPYVCKNILVGHADWVLSVAFSPDGRTLASVARDGTVRRWSLPEGKPLTTLTGHKGSESVAAMGSVAFSPDGRTLASAAEDETIRLWSLPEGNPLATLPHGGVYSVAFSPDGRTLASAAGDGIQLWSLPEGNPLATLPHGGVYSVAFSPDGRTLASAANDRTVRRWGLPEGKPLATLTGHEEAVLSVAFSPDGRTLASADWYGTIRLWSLPEGKPRATLTGPKGSMGVALVGSVAFSPDGRTLASADWYGIQLWGLPEGTPLAILTGRHESVVHSVAFSPDGRTLASAGRDGTIRLWGLPEGKPLVTLTGREGEVVVTVHSVAFSPDGRTLASVAGAGNRVRLWGLPEGTPLATLTGHEGGVHSVVFSPDGETLASAGRYGIQLWGLPEGTPLATLTGYEQGVLSAAVGSVAFSPDGRTLASAARDGVRLWGLPEGTPLATLTGHEWAVSSVAFSPDGRTLASAAHDGTVRLWSLPEGTPLATLTGSKQGLPSVTFSPDGQTLASAAGDGIQLWSLPEGKPLATLTDHEGAGPSVAFSPDGRTLASAAGGDRTVRLWGLPEGKSLATLTGHEGWILNVAFSPDGRTLASAAADETIRLWPQMVFFSLSPEALYRQAQLDTNMRVEGLVAQTLTIEELQALKQHTAH